MYNSVVFSIFRRSCNHHHYLIPKHFHHPKNTLYPAAVTLHFLLSPQTLETTDLLHVSMDLPVLDISHERNYIQCGLLCLASFTQHKLFKVQPCYSMDHSFLWLHYFSWLKNSTLYGYTTFCLSIHQFVDIWVVSTFWLL